MALESINWVSDLVITNPLAADFLTEGDDHIKGIKVALKNSFPSISGAVTATHTELSLLSGVTGAIRTSLSTPLAGEWVLMRDVTTAGAPATIDFLTGVSGVTISTAYDAYLLDLQDIQGDTAMSQQLRLQLTANAGGSWIDYAVIAQSTVLESGTYTNTNHTALTYFPVMGNRAPGGALNVTRALNGTIFIQKSVDNPSNAYIFSEFTQGAGEGFGQVAGQADQTATTAFNGFRLSWSANGFRAANGRVRFFGRKA